MGACLFFCELIINMKLYDYQVDMVEQIEEALNVHRSVMVEMPTGTGKTHVLAAVVKHWVERVQHAEVWIVAHRRELVEQTCLRIKGEGLMVTCGEDVGRCKDVSMEATSGNVLDGCDDGGIGVRVMSVQWLARHYMELGKGPSLFVIDEAHHAVAKSYKVVMEAFKDAQILGLTATPCRLNRSGFTDWFEVLLQSWSCNRFIAEGRLSLYDYMSVRADNKDWKTINSLKRRGADGDFSLREMSEKLNVMPSIERLCDTVLKYAADKKGIVYAIDIAHAENIARVYREHGLKAVAISSKTPRGLREALIRRFKAGDGVFAEGDDEAKGDVALLEALAEVKEGIQILVNVDLFGEGFDCPDVEFIQLARPTLSLAKYLQQVGRGMRVFDGKKFCLILDNVGLYRLFGLPSDDRDWLALFEGRSVGKGNLKRANENVYAAFNMQGSSVREARMEGRTDLITVMSHDGQRNDLELAYRFRTIRNEEGLMGVVDKEGNVVLPCNYLKVELKLYGIAKVFSRKKIDRERPWMDLMNGIRFVQEPWIVKYGFLDFCTSDGKRLYPRVCTGLMDEMCFVTPEALKYGIEEGLRFRNFFIPPSEKDPLLYSFVDLMDDFALFVDAGGKYFYRRGLEKDLHAIDWEDWKVEKLHWKRMVHDFEVRVKEDAKTRVFPYVLTAKVNHGYRLADYKEPTDLRISRSGKCYNTFRYDALYQRWRGTGSYKDFGSQAYGMRVVRNWEGKYLLRTLYFEKFCEGEDPKFDFAELLDEGYLHIKNEGREFFVDVESRICFKHKPELVRIGFMQFQRDGDMYFPFDYRLSGRTPYRLGEIVSYDDFCLIGKDFIIKKDDDAVYYVKQRYCDGKRFVVSKGKNGKKKVLCIKHVGQVINNR